MWRLEVQMTFTSVWTPVSCELVSDEFCDPRIPTRTSGFMIIGSTFACPDQYCRKKPFATISYTSVDTPGRYQTDSLPGSTGRRALYPFEASNYHHASYVLCRCRPGSILSDLSSLGRAIHAYR